MKNVRLLSYVAIFFGLMIALLTLLTVITLKNAKNRIEETASYETVSTELVHEKNTAPEKGDKIPSESEQQYVFPTLK